ncbi:MULTISPECIES: response regulator [unclassified Lysobacter]|uniref:response regulator transcription factor n=1 Tax=unclassified Lysobacter TaxID=2635362 RepID=UPI001C223BE1|nr:response regulator [Lysobacter sp. MMG2]MBU8974563.1 response regulator [Lysobacter sp. MMG2]
MTRVPTIVIVDDDDGVRVSLSSLARSLGYQVRAYPSAQAFLRDTEAGDPDCLVTDIQMPGMTGEQLRDALLAAGRRFPVIFMTAFPNESSRERAMASGACAYLVKPVDGAMIARCLARALAAPRV